MYRHAQYGVCLKNISPQNLRVDAPISYRVCLELPSDGNFLLVAIILYLLELYAQTVLEGWLFAQSQEWYATMDLRGSKFNQR
jgi:hypothetical protein